MPKVKVGDINIYYEVEGEGPPLLMLHGLTSSLEGIRESGYVDALRDDYRIILMDARGHGKSDKPHDPAMYAAELIVGDVLAVLNRLRIEKTNFYGYSYGGGIGYECARLIPRKLISVIVGGAGARLPPLEKLKGQVKFYESGAEAIIATYERSEPIPPNVKAHILANDYKAMVAISKGMMSGPRDYLIKELPKMKMPFLLFVGEADFSFSEVEETSKLLPTATFVSFPGLDHMLGGGRPDLVIPHIKKFLKWVNKK